MPSEIPDSGSVHEVEKPLVSSDADNKPSDIGIVKSEKTRDSEDVLMEEPVSLNVEGGKTVIDEDDDSFESFGSGDRDGKLEEGSVERASIAEKADETPEAQSGRISLSDVRRNSLLLAVIVVSGSLTIAC